MLAFRGVGNFARQTEKGREGEKKELKITQIISEAFFGLESEDPIKQQYKDILITSGDHRYPLISYSSNFGWNAALEAFQLHTQVHQIIFFMFAVKYPQTYITPAFIHRYSTSILVS